MANIITFQTIGAKQSLRDIGRVFSINNADINNLCSLIKQPNISLKEAIATSKELSSLYSDPYFNKIISLAQKIEGLPRQESIHAAGIILNNEDLTNVIPTKIGQDVINNLNNNSETIIEILKNNYNKNIKSGNALD